MICAGSTHHGLMVVVAHRVVVGEGLEIRRVALQHVVEAHRGAAFSGAEFIEAGGLRIAIGAGADGYFDPGE